jgi:hypothetical protein
MSGKSCLKARFFIVFVYSGIKKINLKELNIALAYLSYSLEGKNKN